ncbi:MAG: PD-(D/E)XK nuclease family protein [Verrucomicrobiales bacterium]|nr:PD-(D/E)XK nuclease family protein [Verrucomicrobiales bacterium]
MRLGYKSSITAPRHHSTPPPLTRHFTGWDVPFLASTVASLARDWDGSGSLDLSDHLVLVPTRHAGRRLREALAVHAAKFDSAVLPPLVVTPDFLYAPARLETSVETVASPWTTQLIWTGLLLDLPLGSFRRVFPVDPVERHLKWANDNARELLRVRQTLLESDLDFSEAAAILAEKDIEPGRWSELAAIEARAIALTEKCGLLDAGSASRRAAGEGALPPGIRRLVIAAVADMKPLAIRALTHHAEARSVTILVAAPESASALFDRFGRPLSDAWLTREIPIPRPDQSIHQCANPAAQAALCRELVAPFANPAALVAIGIPDPEVAPTLEQGLADAGLGSYDPAGRPVSKEGIYYLLKLTHQLIATDRYDAFALLLRCPGYLSAALKSVPSDPPLSVGRLLKHFDKLQSETLPDRLSDALASARKRSHKVPALAGIISWTQDWTARFRKEEFTAVLSDYLSAIFEEKRFAPHDPAEAVFSEVADAIHSLAADISSAAAAFSHTPAVGDHFELLLSTLSDSRVYPDGAPRDIDLQGWLELLWEDAPHLIVTGMNDHAVPEAIIGHAFLPDSARHPLGIQNNDDRFARDAYLFTTLIETRRESGGRLDLLFGRQGTSGDPLRPSRLLFQCQDSELAARTLHLFRENELERPPLPRSIAWRLKPSPLPPENKVYQRISVTGFKAYLTCPFRYYLKFGLGMEKVEAGKGELDSRDFGNLVHDTLEALGRDETMRRSTDAGEITEFFYAGIDRWLGTRFGSRLTTPLVIQREAARQRLAHWAQIEASERALGWEIIEVETPFGKDEWVFKIDGMPVTGRIDRIERHRQQGLRVFDFKTISPMEDGRLKTVDRYHRVNVKRTEDPASFPDWALCQDDNGKALHWVDLQIPLYCLAMAERFPGEAISAGYVTLGKTEAEVRIDLWSSLDEATITSARTCAQGVIAAIRNSVFWPPNEKMPDWDDFRELLSPTADEAVDVSGFKH